MGGGSVETIGKILPMEELYHEGGNWDGEKMALGAFLDSFKQPKHVENLMKDKIYAPKKLHDEEQ